MGNADCCASSQSRLGKEDFALLPSTRELASFGEDTTVHNGKRIVIVRRMPRTMCPKRHPLRSGIVPLVGGVFPVQGKKRECTYCDTGNFKRDANMCRLCRRSFSSGAKFWGCPACHFAVCATCRGCDFVTLPFGAWAVQLDQTSSAEPGCEQTLNSHIFCPPNVAHYMASKQASLLCAEFLNALSQCPIDDDGARELRSLWAAHEEYAPLFIQLGIEPFLCQFDPHIVNDCHEQAIAQNVIIPTRPSSTKIMEDRLPCQWVAFVDCGQLPRYTPDHALLPDLTLRNQSLSPLSFPLSAHRNI